MTWALRQRDTPKCGSLWPHWRESCIISIITIILVVPGIYTLTSLVESPSSHGRTQSPHGECFAVGGWCLSGERGDRQDRVAALQTSHSLQGPRLTLFRSICRDVLGGVGDLPTAHPSWCRSANRTGRWSGRPALQRAWNTALL